MKQSTLPSTWPEFLESGGKRTHTHFKSEIHADNLNPFWKKTVVLYHENCWDGITAAWCARRKLKDTAVYIPVNYNRPLPNVDWTKVNAVYIVDFSYSSEILDELYAAVNGNLLVLDHHKTARKQLAGKPYAVFNQNLSGAGLAWLAFNLGFVRLGLERAKHAKYGSAYTKEMPKFVYYVQDYDLWAFKDKKTKAFRLGLDQFPRAISTIQKIHDARVNEPSRYSVESIIRLGTPLLNYKNAMIEEAAKNAFLMEFPSACGLGYGVISSNPSLTSELGNVLALRAQKEGYAGYAAIFSVNKKSIQNNNVLISLRSVGDIDVSQMAENFGGGGHAEASGCSWSYKYFLKFMGRLGDENKEEAKDSS